MQTLSCKTSRRFLAILAGLALAGAAAAAPTNRYVAMPGAGGHIPPFTNWAMAATSIIDAVALANTYNEGDTVWIAAGHYVLTQTVSVGNTRVRGFTGAPDDVLVDGDAQYRCFRMDNPGAILRDLTVTNGASQDTAGISFSSNAVGAVVSNCAIVNCTATRYDGGIAAAPNSYMVLLNSRIQGNMASSGSGGIRVDRATCLIRNCLISQNTGSSGGLNLSAGSVIDCVITGNTASGSGGGIYVNKPDAAVPIFSNCLVLNNSSVNTGGGVVVHRPVGDVIFYNCLIANNTSGNGGGIYWNHYLSGTHFGEYYNCTIAGNSATNVANVGGVFKPNIECIYGMYNTIIYSNTPVDYIIDIALLSNCCATGLVGNANVTNYPAFINPAHSDYRLRSGSPCINAGANQPWMAEASDLDGRPRLDRFTRQADIGAYEYIFRGVLFSVQ